jgi:1-acyl-sn-glycerol-3-phosphate acyltransferase
MAGLVVWLRSALFNLCFFSWSMLAAILFAPIFMHSSRASLWVGNPWAKGVLLLARFICGITFEIRGTPYASSRVIYASKHQSAWDTVIFLTLFNACPAYVLKRELLRIPLWGWYLWRMKMIAIDRSGAASSMKQMIRDSKEALDDGRSIVIFPEGTRTVAGQAGEYHPGVVALYGFLKVPVVPVALNSGVYWGKDAFLKKPGKIILEYLPPIDAGMPKEQFAATLQESIESASMRLYNEALNNKK